MRVRPVVPLLLCTEAVPFPSDALVTHPPLPPRPHPRPVLHACLVQLVTRGSPLQVPTLNWTALNWTAFGVRCSVFRATIAFFTLCDQPDGMSVLFLFLFIIILTFFFYSRLQAPSPSWGSARSQTVHCLTLYRAPPSMTHHMHDTPLPSF